MKTVVKSGTSLNQSKANSIINPVCEFVYMNDGVRICSEACSCCWDVPNPESYDDKVTYLGKRAKIGHTSIFEHSNLITLVKIPSNLNDDAVEQLVDFLTSCRYLNSLTRKRSSDGTSYILIGGSWRAYENAFILSKDPVNNPFFRSVAGQIYKNSYSQIFYKLTEMNILNPDAFSAYVEPASGDYGFNDRMLRDPFYEDDKIKILSYDDIFTIKENLQLLIGEDIFSVDDISRVATISILFKNMSRTCTHQLVRHRNAITQESQRYVDYSNAAFADPVSFKPERYNEDTKYDISFAGTDFSMTSNEIGEAIIGIYHNMKDQGMLKEDARSFLPGNVRCRKIYMTFTFSNYLKFLELRCDKHAQAEIRSYALDCLSATEPVFDSLKDQNTNNSNNVDVIIADKEVIANSLINANEELSSKE